MRKRTYTGEADLHLLQNFNSRAIAVTDHCGFLHPGDIPHHIYSGNRSYDPAELTTLWEDNHGIAAWLLVNIKYKSFDAQVRPDLRGNDFERDVLGTAEERTVELMSKYDISSKAIFADSFRGDTSREQLLKNLGWEPDNELPYVLNQIQIPNITLPTLPAGYLIRSAKGIEDAAGLAEVLNGAFGPIWTPEVYRKVMESPGYEPDRELVIQAPDGTFAAFCVIRYDLLNRTGLFEPVGTHKENRRHGFGRAIMLYGLHQMAAAGMEYATVAHFGDNEAARCLYQSLGFKPWYLLDGYTKATLF